MDLGKLGKRGDNELYIHYEGGCLDYRSRLNPGTRIGSNPFFFHVNKDNERSGAKVIIIIIISIIIFIPVPPLNPGVVERHNSPDKSHIPTSKIENQGEKDIHTERSQLL